MSTAPDLDLNLETLFQPAWAQGKSEPVNRFEKFTGNEGNRPERRSSGKPGERRGPRRDGGGGGFGGGGFGGGAPRGENRGGGDRPRFGGPRPQGGRPGDKPGGRGGFRGDRRDDRQDDRRERPEPPAPLPDLNVAFIPDEKGVEQLARQIKITGRAYPLFQIALLILQKPERYGVQLTSKKKDKPDAVVQKIYVCGLDDSPWTSEDEAVAHILKNHFATFYQAERTPTDPPKGTYTFVAQCGMSGVILGPPNYHDYQNKLHKLHAERFARMPFDVFKSRVKIVKDEAVVKKWIEEQSFKTEYTCLNVPEPLKLPTMEEVEKHFRATHKDSVIKAVESHLVAGLASRTLRSSGLQRLIRQTWEDQKHFPLPIATKLSQQFAQHGLQFFKVNKTVTHVSVARPQYLDLETNPVSDGIKRIVDFINTTPKCTRKKLVEALAPKPKPAKPAAPAPAEAPAAPAPTEGTAPATDAATPAAEAAKPAEARPAEAKAPEPSPEQTAVMSDLHWLIHQGHVLEFADGRMETAKKPAPKPPKAEKKPEAPAAAAAPAEGTAPETAAATPAEVTSTESVAVASEPTAVQPAAEASAPAPESSTTPGPSPEPGT